ncbi:MarR family winged helix-turn-helix transcriptional regulator [Jatrophihabitans sp. YIM 134969]
MSQATAVDALAGYAIKRAQAALHARMERDLRPLGVTVSQYSCLELLAQRPGISNAELARGAFVSRQSMNVLLRGLEERELVRRDYAAVDGRAVPTRLTASGTRLIHRARAVIAPIEAELTDAFGARSATVVRSLHAAADRLDAG